MTDSVSTLVHGWRVERRDGVRMGFSAHDRDLWHDGLRLRAAPGLVPGQVVQRAGVDADSVDVQALLSDDAITAADLLAGRWDGATVRLFLIDWADPAAPVRPLVTGWLGEVEHDGEGFRAELRSAAARLDQPVVPHTSPSCRARFCDAACQLPRAAFLVRARLVSAEGARLTFDTLPPLPDDGFAFGQLRWLGGPQCGRSHAIAASAGALVELEEALPTPPAPGTPAELFQGCDRQFTTCADRFANALNFQGEPYLPGNDLLTRYPGGA